MFLSLFICSRVRRTTHKVVSWADGSNQTFMVIDVR